MDYSRLGSIMTVGMILLLTVNLNRRAARSAKYGPKPMCFCRNGAVWGRMP